MGLGKKNKKSKNLPPPPGLPPLPAPPAPGMPLPPLPPAPAPAPAAAPPAPPAPAPPAPPEPAVEALAPPQPAVVPEPEPVDESNYSSLYAKKSGKPLQQVYGHIERIGTGEVGSLLERYSDRFGHELDRDIIVMRRDEREDKLSEVRDSPTVQLIGAAAEEEESHLDSDTLIELNTQLKSVEDELRRIKPEYQAAKEEGDRDLLRQLRPTLETLMSERKMIKAVIAGDAELDELLSMGEDEDEEEAELELEEEEYEEEAELELEEVDDEDLFVDFVAIVDSLLGSNLPEDAIKEFTESDGFEIYRSVGSDPSSASEDERSEFFSVVDSLLGGMPDEAVSSFVASDDFETYRAIGAMYS